MIDDKIFLSKIISYLERNNIKYTTDISDDYDRLLVAEINKKTISLIKENHRMKKKIIFITHLEELKIQKHYALYNKRSTYYKSKLYNNLNMCYLVIVSLPYFKKILSSKINSAIEVIERELPYYEAYNKKVRSKKEVVCVDPDYDNINYIYKLAIEYPKYKFKVLGYSPSYHLPKKTKDLLISSPSNIIYIKYYDHYTFIDLNRNSFMIIYFDHNLLNFNYLYSAFLMKKIVLLKNNEIYDDYIVNSKNGYLFDKYEELNMKFKKISHDRVANLSGEMYEMIKNNNFDKISVKFGKKLQ
jgi:hypothetical protein